MYGIFELRRSFEKKWINEWNIKWTFFKGQYKNITEISSQNWVNWSLTPDTSRGWMIWRLWKFARSFRWWESWVFQPWREECRKQRVGSEQLSGPKSRWGCCRRTGGSGSVRFLFATRPGAETRPSRRSRPRRCGHRGAKEASDQSLVAPRLWQRNCSSRVFNDNERFAPIELAH